MVPLIPTTRSEAGFEAEIGCTRATGAGGGGGGGALTGAWLPDGKATTNSIPFSRNLGIIARAIVSPREFIIFGSPDLLKVH